MIPGRQSLLRELLHPRQPKPFARPGRCVVHSQGLRLVPGKWIADSAGLVRPALEQPGVLFCESQPPATHRSSRGKPAVRTPLRRSWSPTDCKQLRIRFAGSFSHPCPLAPDIFPSLRQSPAQRTSSGTWFHLSHRQNSSGSVNFQGNWRGRSHG